MALTAEDMLSSNVMRCHMLDNDSSYLKASWLINFLVI